MLRETHFVSEGAAQMNLRSEDCDQRGALACNCGIGDPYHVDFPAAAANETEAENVGRISMKRPPDLVAAALLGMQLPDT